MIQRAESRGRAYLGWPAPEHPEEAIDDSEYDFAILARLKTAGKEASKGAAAYLLSANTHLARALRARARRWRNRWTPADGLVDPAPETVELLKGYRLAARAYSPTALESYGACPYRFFLQGIYRLRTREEVEALEALDPLTRGALIHEAQYRVLTELRSAQQLPLVPRHLDGAFGMLDRVITRVAAEYRERLAPAIPRVWEDGIEGIRLDLREWLRQMTEDPRWVPWYFEWSFGVPRDVRPNADPASAVEPAQVLGSALLRGSIDLIERRADGTLRVTDHKTGKAEVEEGACVSGGRSLQPLLYALAAEVLLQAPVESGRLYYCTSSGEFIQRTVPLDEQTRAHARAALDLIDRALEQGFLPAAPAAEACDTCRYRLVCGPHEPHRTSQKPRGRLTDLHALRELP